MDHQTIGTHGSGRSIAYDRPCEGQDFEGPHPGAQAQIGVRGWHVHRVLSIANGTEYGLVAGVWSGDGSRAVRVGRKMIAGQVFINGYGAGGGIELPFGGMKKSGHGREKGFEALYEFSASRTLVIKHG